MTIEQIKNNCKVGWKLNPNPKIVEGVIKGINRCGGECPCVNDSVDKMCPCSDYRLHNKCHCNIYVEE